MKPKKAYRLWKRGKYFAYRLPGMKTWKTTEETTKTDAEIFVVDLLRKGKSRTTMTLKQYAEPYFKYEECPHIRRLLDEGKSYTRRTAQQNRGWLEKQVLKDEIANKLLAEITRADLIDFRSRLRQKLGEKRNTVNKVMGVVKTIFKEAVFREDLQSDPTAGIGNIKEDRTPPDTFNLAELQLLFPVDTLGPWAGLEDHACFLITASTGMRRGEVLALRWEQLHVDEGYILVDRAWKDAQTEGKPKWEHVRTARIVLFQDRVEKRLQELKEKSVFTAQSDYVFCDPAGNPRGFTWWKKHFKAAMDTFDPETKRRLSPHGLRHLLATILRVNGKDPALIRASLGWYQERTQERYEHISGEDLSVLDIE